VKRAVILWCLLLVSSQAQATDLESLIKAVTEGGIAKGQVQVDLVFPPNKNPSKIMNRLPNLGVLPPLVRQNFEVFSSSPDTVLGREVTRLELHPKIFGAGQWVVWIDKNWNTPLAFEQHNFEGKLLRRAAYTSLEATPPQPRKKPEVQNPKIKLNRLLSKVLPSFVPPSGFEAVSLKRGMRGQLETLEINFSDGLNTFPMIITSKNTKGEGIQTRRLGEVWIWMVGSFPKGTLEKSLSSLTETPDVGNLGTLADSPDANK
jgi:negative regulator of sigma E activity